MDDLAHESRPIHSLNRKRKADQDDRNPAPAAPDPAAPADTMRRIGVQATPRCPAPDAPGPSASPWPLARAAQGMSPPWPQSPTAAPAFLQQRTGEGPPAPKRLRIEIPCTPPGSPHRARRTPHRPASRLASRHRRAGDAREAGVASAVEESPRKPLLRTASLPSLPSHTRSLPVSPTAEPVPVSPHVPPHQPPINRETLKELDLEAILRNPQLRQSPFPLRLASICVLIHVPVL